MLRREKGLYSENDIIESYSFSAKKKVIEP